MIAVSYSYLTHNFGNFDFYEKKKIYLNIMGRRDCKQEMLPRTILVDIRKSAPQDRTTSALNAKVTNTCDAIICLGGGAHC